MRRRRLIAPRTPVFLGCEGESEAGYGALLGRLIRDTPTLRLHIHVEPLQPGAGDPHALVRRAAQRIADIERRRERFACKAVLLDEGDPPKNVAARQLADAHGIAHLIWQRPDHEAFLLRHLDGCESLQPPAGTTFHALRQKWPDYEKASTQLQLSRHITMAGIRRACGVEAELNNFLAAIGVLPRRQDDQ